MLRDLVDWAVYLIGFALVVGLLIWIVDQIKAFAPYAANIRIAILVVSALIIIYIILQVMDGRMPNAIPNR